MESTSLVRSTPFRLVKILTFLMLIEDFSLWIESLINLLEICGSLDQRLVLSTDLTKALNFSTAFIGLSGLQDRGFNFNGLRIVQVDYLISHVNLYELHFVGVCEDQRAALRTGALRFGRFYITRDGGHLDHWLRANGVLANLVYLDLWTQLGILENQLTTGLNLAIGADHYRKRTKGVSWACVFVRLSNTGVLKIHR